MMKTLSLLTLIVTLFTACQSTPIISETEHQNNTIQIPTDSSQLLVVTTPNWNEKNGILQRYEKHNTHWEKVGHTIPIVLGRNGLGWGKGLHKTPKNAPYIKHEGDGKAPAGLFRIGHAFGYNPLPFDIDLPYSVYKTTDHCVDDSHSKWYNQIVDSTTATQDYKSFEHMKLENHLYKYGLTINHNPDNMANDGSCIFMHIWDGTQNGTAGCTTMIEDEIIELLKWIDEKRKPLLLQLPIEEMPKLNP